MGAPPQRIAARARAGRAPRPSRDRAAGRAARRIAAAALCALSLAACATTRPASITTPDKRAELRAAAFFPYFRVYWVGLRFQGIALTSADGLANYNPTIGETLQYGGCDAQHALLHTGGCQLPLQVATVAWRPHSNSPLGQQTNTIIRGVPAVVFDGGGSIELYTGKVAIDVSADSAARARAAALALRPLNAPGSASSDLPLPDFCPGLVGTAPPYEVARDATGRMDCVDIDTLGGGVFAP